MLRVRNPLPAFNPLSPQQILEIDHRLFSLLRGEGNDQVLCLINISAEKVQVEIDPNPLDSNPWVDLLTDRQYSPGKIQLDSYQTLWLV